MADDLLPELARILHEVVGVDPDVVTPDQRFVDDLGVDSLSMIEFVVAVAEQFAVLVPDDEVRHLRTVDDARVVVQRLLGS